MGILKFLRCLMVFLNGVVFMGGLCLLCLGIWQIVDPSGIQKLLSNRYLEAGSYIVVFLGVMLAFMGYVGCYGAISDNPWMLCYFCVTLLMLLMVEITVISLLQFKGKRKVQQDYIWRFMKENYQGDKDSDPFSRAWNTFMITFECCGVSGPDDFKTSLYFLENQPKDKWPEACCTRAGVGERAPIKNLRLCKAGDKEYLNENGCFDAVTLIAKKYVVSIEAACFTLIVIQLLASFCACCLCCFMEY